MKNGIIFDLDGTLWDSAYMVVKAFNDEIRNYPEVNFTLTEEMLKSQMGKTAEEIARVFFPDLSAEKGMYFMKVCNDRECAYLTEFGGKLYPQLKETLCWLKENDIHLYLVSNCGDDYIQAFLSAHQMKDIFEDTECHGKTGLFKGENIRLIMQRNFIDKACYVGDTQGDCNATRYAEIPFVYAKYGFGNVTAPDYTINTFSEIMDISKTIFS